MSYIIIIVLAIIIVSWVWRKCFRWETVIEYLWKQIYQLADLMAIQIKTGNETLYIEEYKKKIDLRGNIINSILDFVNYLKKEEDKNAEEETFRCGRYKFETILYLARSDSEAFKRILKRK